MSSPTYTALKTPVSALQEFLTEKRITAVYEQVGDRIGPSHNPTFKMQVFSSGYVGVGEGKSKKEAKHNAAESLLEQLLEAESKDSSALYSPLISSAGDGNLMGELFRYCCEHRISKPEFITREDVQGEHFVTVCKIVCESGAMEVEGSGRNKKESKHASAAQMLNRLRDQVDSDSSVSAPMKRKYKPKLNDNLIQQILDSRPVESAVSTSFWADSFSTAHTYFQSEGHPKSETLEKIKMLDSRFVESVENPFGLFIQIIQEMGYQYSVADMPSVKSTDFAVILHIVCPPSWSFLGTGESKEEAIVNAAVFGIRFLMVMAR